MSARINGITNSNTDVAIEKENQKNIFKKQSRYFTINEKNEKVFHGRTYYRHSGYSSSTKRV